MLGPENKARPFCSARCKMLDLERWFTGGYRVPGPPVDTSMLEGEGALRDDDFDDAKGFGGQGAEGDPDPQAWKGDEET